MDNTYKPKYLHAYSEKIIQNKIIEVRNELNKCKLCPRNCKVNRNNNEKGICRTGYNPVVSSYSPHFGEESVLVGKKGSGTIFFTHCNLRCNFCQNYDTSIKGEGEEVTVLQLAQMMLDLQQQGCHNINYVTPTHVAGQILEALEIAIAKGLKIPLVYNTSAYDEVETLQFFDGIMDIYMPDFKFFDKKIAAQTCKAPDYPKKAKLAIKEMHRQVGDLVIDKNGIAQKGLLIRHLVMPDNMAGTKDIMDFIATEISKDTYINIMQQYRPCGEAKKIEDLNRTISNEEYQVAVEFAKKAGLHNFL